MSIDGVRRLPRQSRVAPRGDFLIPFVNIKLVDGVFTSTQKRALAKAMTDVMVKFEGPRRSGP
ncbi:tautomerase family protein [Sinorhizobium meliloti]|nr:tautomerase family protein [Sinorhizobium meliloti]MDE4548014.1 tautomerase family protein [Sinorhizobium meliloti]MDE4571633.1 tautomerase family protein [Sinorhizobium meliloti]